MKIKNKSLKNTIPPFPIFGKIWQENYKKNIIFEIKATDRRDGSYEYSRTNKDGEYLIELGNLKNGIRTIKDLDNIEITFKKLR